MINASQQAMQNKEREISFFDSHAEGNDYNVFTDVANCRLIDEFFRLTELPPDAAVAGLGCGSGVFTRLLRSRGICSQGVDISPKLIQFAAKRYPEIPFRVGDVEDLPFQNDSLDGLLQSGVVHHFPDPGQFAFEGVRVLRKGDKFFAFDPNRHDPFMYLYRDRLSPFYSPIGVTENERPIIAKECVRTFVSLGFSVRTEFLSGLAYRDVASRGTRLARRACKFIEALLFCVLFQQGFSAFVFSFGKKP